MNKKTLLVLAATLYQVPFIVQAKALGFRVVTVDNVPSNPGHALADCAYCVDTTDISGVLAVAEAESIQGVLAACTDVALPAAAAVAESLGICGPPRSAVETVCDKIAFRRWQNASGLPAPETVSPTDLSRDFIPPGWWILKPARSSGSKGIFIIRSYKELHQRLEETLHFSPDSRVVLEQYLPGRQITCEGILSGGRIVSAWILDRQVPSPPFVVTTGHHVPTVLSDRQQAAVISAIGDCWRRLGVTDGPFDCDAVVDGQRVFILEMTPRVGGNSISRLLNTACGFDMVNYAVRQALGEDPPHPPLHGIPRPAGLCILGADRSGVLQYSEPALMRLREAPWVVGLRMDRAPGERVDAFMNGRHRLGEAIVLGRDRDEVDARILELKTRLKLQAV